MVNDKNSKLNIWKVCAAGILLTVAISSNVKAGDESLNIDQVNQCLDTVWVLHEAFLVFFMQAGFGTFEAGFERVYSHLNRRNKVRKRLVNN